MSDIDVALEALRSDAKVWDGATDSLNGPIAAISGLTLTGADFSMWAVDRGLDRTYDEARSALDTQLRQAAENFRKIAETLAQAADTYQREEEANLHTFNSTY